MKKNVIYGIIALLSVSLFFLGCPTEASDSDSGLANIAPDSPAGPPVISGGQAAWAAADDLNNKLQALLPAGVDLTGIVDVVNDNEIILDVDKLKTANGGSVPTIPRYSVPDGAVFTPKGSDPITIETLINSGTVKVDGANLTVKDGTNTGAVEVAGGKTLTVANEFTNSGTLDVTGTLTVDAGGIINNDTGSTIKIDGATAEYTLGSGVTGVNNGTVLIGPTATVKSEGNLTGTGTNVVEAGGTVYFNDGLGDVFVGASGKFQLGTDATFTYNNAGYVIAGGAVTLNDADLVIDSEVQQLTIKEDGVLIIPSSKSLRLKATGTDTATKPTLKGEDNAVVRISSGGTVVFDSCDSNFYDNGGSLLSTPISTDDDYNWDAGIKGWRKNS